MMGLYDSVEDEGMAFNRVGKWPYPTENYTYTKIGKYHSAHVAGTESECPYCRYRAKGEEATEAEWESVVRWIREGAQVEVVASGKNWLRIRRGRVFPARPRSAEQNRVYQFLRYGERG